jgi:hypothetical protein
MTYTIHYGLNYRTPTLHLFTLNLLDATGKAVAFVNVTNGIADIFGAIPALWQRKKEIIDLAIEHAKNPRPKIEQQSAQLIEQLKADKFRTIMMKTLPHKDKP